MMVLDKSLSNGKRKSVGHNKGPQSKKRKGTESEDAYDSDTFFCTACKRAGLNLKNGNKYNVLVTEPAVFQKNLLKELRSKGAAETVDKFIDGFDTYMEESKRFHKSLLPSVPDPDGNNVSSVQPSVVKLLLGIDLLQPSLMNALAEKLAEFTGKQDCVILEHGQKVDIPHLLLSQFQWLDHIVNSKEISEKLLEMIPITCEDVQIEVIACLPYIIQDSEHTSVATALRQVMEENKQLTVPVLDTLSNLILTPELLAEIRESVLQSLMSVDLEHLPVLVKFLLHSVSSNDAQEVMSELRANLEFDSSTVKSNSKPSSTNRRNSTETCQDVETLILETIKFAVRFQRHVGDALIKAIECVKLPGNHKVIDLFLLLILHGTPRKKVVESLMRNKIRAGCFTEAYLQNVFSVDAQVLKGYFSSILKLAWVLLRSPELPVSYFGCALYKQTFVAFEVYHRQEVIGNLIEHIGSGLSSEVDAALDILTFLVNKHLKHMAPFAVLLESMLDYLDHMSVSQIRKLYYMLSALAFRNPQEGSHIEDGLNIVIRKQLSNNNQKYKRMGVIGAVTIVSCIAQNRSSAEGSPETDDIGELSEDLYKQVTSLLLLVRSCSSKSSEAFALFMDELSSVVAQGKLVSKVEEWITENLTQDFQDCFVVDVDEESPKESGRIPLDCLYGLDEDAEGSIAINLLPLVVQKYGAKTGINAYTESGLTDPLCIAPSVRLLRVCEERQHGNLENIDALLGCPVFLTKEEVYEKFEPLSQREKDIILSAMFYSINWFIEMVNGFAGQTDVEIKGKVITRLQNITELQKMLLQCLSAYPQFNPPLANFDLDEGARPSVAMATGSGSKGEGKKKKGRKTVGKKGSGKSKPSGSDSDENSRDGSQLNTTTATSQAEGSTQREDGQTESQEKAAVSLTPYKPFFRELDIGVFTILATGSISKASLDSEENTKAVTDLSLQMPQVQFLMEDLCRKLEHSLLASATKRVTFFKSKGDKKVGFSKLEQLSPLEVASHAIRLLPALCNHLEAASGFFQALIAENDGMLDGPGSHSREANVTATCFQLLLQSLLTLFSWNGFQMTENRDLLKKGLGVLVHRIKSSGQSQMSMRDHVRTAMQYVGNFASTVPDIYTAVTLLKLLTSLAEKTEEDTLSRKLVPLAEDFLKREWLTADGQREKGSKFNEQLHFIIRAYIVQSEDPLSAIETIATKAIPELLETDKNGCSASYPTMNRSSYSVFYRVLFTELIEAVKGIPPAKHTDHLDTWIERLLRWNVGVRILHILVNLMKTFDGRSNLGTCIKYGRFFIEVFLRLGMPLLDKMFKGHRQDIHGLLKNLQQSTRALHHMCGHSKIIKDVSLTNQVPMLKRCLETFVFRVKAMLTVNKCLEAFWMGNLKNRDLHGEEILSQTAVSQEETDGGDSDGETLPDEVDELSDVELDRESTASNETGENDVTDPEGSLSQMY